MSDDVKKLRTLVDRYKLSQPVPPELQRYAIRSRTPELRRILKKSGRYGLVTWLVIMIFMLFRKYGLHVTMLQSKIIAGVTAAAVASGSAAVAYRGVKYIIETKSRPAAQVEEPIAEPEPEAQNKIDAPTPTTQSAAPAELTRAEQKQPATVQKERPPVEKKLPEKEKQEKAKKKGAEHNTMSDIPSL